MVGDAVICTTMLYCSTTKRSPCYAGGRIQEDGVNKQTSGPLWQQLREELVLWVLAPYALLAVGLVLANLGASSILPPSPIVLGMLLLVLVALSTVAARHNYVAGIWLITTGHLAMVLLCRAWFPASAIGQTAFIPVIIASMVLGATGGLVLAGLATITLLIASALMPATVADSPLPTTIGTIWCVAYLMAASQRPSETMIRWVWQGYDEARRNLAAARDRQVELKQALQDLDLANREVLRLNDLLAAAREELDEARRAKEEFVANVSHELRTPLNMIIGFSNEIVQRPDLYSETLPAELIEDIVTINRNSRHLARLVDDVLDLVEAESGFTRLTKEWSAIGEVVRQATDSMAAFFDKKGLRLDVHIPANLPLVYCDRARISQVILNLLSNAARFTKSGGATVAVDLQDSVVTIKVTDTGEGIEPTSLRHLFEPFQQADPSIRRRHGGTGLGLAIAKRFVELHGGRIWIESTVNAGTTVSFSLPLGQGAEAPGPKRWFSPYLHYEARAQPSSVPVKQPAPRVLVVEPGDSLANLVRHYLHDVELTATQTVDAARNALQTEPVRALVMNELVTQGALGTLAQLPESPFDIPIISCWVPETETAIRRMGAQDYLVKPVDREDLLASLSRAAPNAHKVLLVEDDAEAQALFQRMLSAATPSLVVRTATDGASALQALRSWRPDVVLLDLVLPGQDGFAVLAHKAEDEDIRDIPVIVISARDPQREPVMSNALVVTRQGGLSARDLALLLEAILAALPPRFAARVPHGNPGPSPASGQSQRPPGRGLVGAAGAPCTR